MDEWVGDTVKRSAITRDTRFADDKLQNEFSPAGVEKIIRSHAHRALLCDLGKARRTGLRIFMASAHNSADVREIQNPGTRERLAKYLALITANPQRRPCATLAHRFFLVKKNKRIKAHIIFNV
jgi:hypothetical protein